MSDSTLPPATRQPSARRLPRARGGALCAALALAVSLAGCGESQRAKAEKTVCGARSEIQAKVDHLKTIPPSLTTLPEIKNEVQGIATELKKIQGAQADLSSARRQQVQQATAEFGEKVRSALSSIVPSLQLASVAAQLRSTVASLASSYAQALAPVQCG